MWFGTCAATFATGFYTYLIDWNPVVRVGAHLAGALAIPAGGAFVSSLVMRGIEGIANLGINSFNKKHPEKTIDPFEINPKVKNAIKLLSSAAVGIAYTYGTLGTEVTQFNNSGIFQAEQYLADIGGSLAGIVAFHTLDIKDTSMTFFNGAWELGKKITKPINAFEEKIFGKNKTNPEKASNLVVEEINVTPEIGKSKEEERVWDLSSSEKQNLHTPVTTTIEKTSLVPEDNKLNPENEINI